MADLSLALRVAVPAALVASAVAVWLLDRPGGDWGTRLRSRLLLGVPWGTLVTFALVLGVYLFVQGGYWHWYDPVVVAFSSWSYLYPLGVVAAPFSHAGVGHLTGNLLGTLALAPLAEYAWSHFPTERGTSSFASWRTNPYVRSFVLFPLGVVGIGLATSLFSWGPVVGFSGVVFAFAGFALVRFPLATVVTLAARGLVATTYYALRDPVVVGQASPSYGPPWWFGIAVQGHLLGLLLGVVVGVLVLARRDRRPSALRLWTGTVLLGSSLTLWAIWWYRGPETYVLYRGLGVTLVLALGLLVAVAARASDRPVVGDGGLTRRRAAIMLVGVPLLTMAMVAVPLNLTTVADGDLSGESVAVEGYQVTYAEDVPNRKIPAFDFSLFGESTNVTTSGVIVVHEDRQVWSREISTGALAFDGERSVRVGGVGWSRTVTAHREGWSTQGGPTAYQVWLRAAADDWTHVFASRPATAEPTIAGRNVTVVPENGSFLLQVSRGNDTLARAPMPAENETARVGGLRFDHTADGTLVAIDNQTRVQVAHRETYE
jgi:membrane associated rhomboid family serine protease